MARLSNFTCHHAHVFQEHSENILPSSEGDVGLTASSGPSVLGHKVDEECVAADPPEISDAQNNRKRCRDADKANGRSNHYENNAYEFAGHSYINLVKLCDFQMLCSSPLYTTRKNKSE
ncbi:hypothetical protein YC2023_015517 [Brassica napus]